MSELRIRAYSKNSVSEKDRELILEDLKGFAENITNIGRDNYEIEVREGSLEIIIVTAIGVAKWVAKEIGSYEIKRRLDKYYQERVQQKDSSVHTNEIDESPQEHLPVKIDYSAIGKAIQLKEQHQLYSFSIGVIKGDGSGNVAKIYGDPGEPNLEIHQTETREDYYRLFKE